MSLRHIPYGYRIEKGTPVIVPEEAEIVSRIFHRYDDGETLLAVADSLTEQQIDYYEGKRQWNKNMIARILENRKYIGEETYPPIVSRQLFDAVNRDKNQKGAHKLEGTAEIEYLRGVLLCGNCGGKMQRKGKWKTREKWLCRCGCKAAVYISDDVITDGIRECFMRIKNDPVQIECVYDEKDFYHPTVEVTKQENEVLRLLEAADIPFGVVKKTVLTAARLRFSCCDENPAEAYTELLKAAFESYDGKFDVDYLKLICKGFRANIDGTVTVILKNGAEIRSTEVQNAC